MLASGDGFAVRALLHKSLNQAQQAFAPLDQNILLIALAALSASLGGALLLARSVSQPVQQLAAAAERVRQGDYQASLALHRSDELGRLATAFKAMQQGIAERERQLAHNALHDALTGLPNRTLALERLGSAITAQRPTALLYLGVANFRAVNESLGPQGGDAALQQLSARLQATLRPDDSVARIIGDEFLLLLEHTDTDGAVGIADNVQQLLLKPLRVGAQDVVMECRIGIASYPVDGNAPQELLRRATIAIQDAAATASNLQVYQRGRDDAQQRQICLIRDLRHAPTKAELQLHYQPKLDIADGQVRQAEALLRWQHPELGMISPGEFIPLAERSGSITLLTAWVIEGYISASRLILGGAFGYNLLLNGSLRYSRANELGLLGFGGDRRDRHSVLEEGSVAVLFNPRWALGVEYREKPDNLSFAGESDWADLFLGYFPNKNVALVLACARLGRKLAGGHE